QAVYVAPVTETEAVLCEIWQELLGLERVGITDNFFELGGHSLLITRLITRINQKLDLQLTVTQLFEFQTIQQIIEHIKYDSANSSIRIPSDPENLVLLKKGNKTLVPLFFIHPVGGNAHCYLALANAIDYQGCIYAIQKQETDERSIEEMASHYIDIINIHGTPKKYNLLGWSMGGVIAYEMAQQLPNESVSLTMLDSFNPAKGISYTEQSERQESLQMLGIMLSELGIRFSQFQHLVDENSIEELIEYALHQGIKQHVLPHDFTVQEFTQRYQVLLENNAALKAYRPVKLDRQVTIISAAKSQRNSGAGWEDITAGLKNVSVNGDHFSIITMPNVLITAAEINTVLRDNILTKSADRQAGNLVS
uniref:thioesterase domain-containing protein n=1 Tax=Paraglaciecola sp. TaxID=1920173 RepID=UPI0030F465EA